MASVKYFYSGEIESPCFCWRLFTKFCEQLNDLRRYEMLVKKGIDNLSVEEDLFVVRFEVEEVKSLYKRLQGFVFPCNVCGCGRKYELLSFEMIHQFQRNLNGIDYIEIT